MPRLVATYSTRALYAWLLGITLVGAGLRVYNLGRASLWFDELFTVRSCATFGVPPPLHKPKVLGYMPTSLALWAQGISPSSIPAQEPQNWRALGITEVRMRLASVVLGIITIPLLGLAGCRVIGTRAAVIAAALLAVAPWHIYWSQAARFYSLQFLLYNLSLIWYFRATHEESPARMVAAMAAMILAFLTQPPALVIVGIFALDWIIALARKQPVRLGRSGWVCAIVALALCGASLRTAMASDPQAWDQFSGRYYHTPVKLILGTVYMVGPVVAAFALLSGWWLPARRRRLVIYLLLAALVPTLVYACVSMRSYVGLRYTFVCLYGWLALAALGVDRLYQMLKRRTGRLAAISPMILMIAAMMVTNHAYFTAGFGFHPRWRDAYAYVAKHRQPDDIICGYPFMGRYYLEDSEVNFVPETASELRSFDRPAWIVVRAEGAVLGRRYPWLDELTELKAYFDLRVVQPYSSVRVYLYRPSTAE